MISAWRKPKTVSAVQFVEPLPPDMVWWRHAASECLKRQNVLGRRECDFVAAMWEWEGRPSQKQIDWLMAIHARLYPVRGAA
jgi:hypothetical protein